MQLKPDELPDMVEGEVRRVGLNLSGAVGVNSINSSTATSDNLTLGATSNNGTTVSFSVTASQQGSHNILVTALLSSSETIKGYIKVKVVGEPCTQSDDY
jgi:hypothetical protein